MSTIMQNYQSDPRVENVEINKTREVQGIPADPKYSSQWALPHIGWDLVCGTVIPVQSSKVAVLDTGVQATLKDLAKSVIKGFSFINGSNGLTDPNGHGTWLAGIIAAMSDNNFGIAGIGCNKVKIMPVQVMGADGTGQDSDIINGVIWAADNGADVILMGFSNPGFSQYLQEAIDYAWSRNIVLVAATGNIGISDPTFPAGDRGVVGVSATDQSDNLAFFSNFGQSVFLAGPGVDILTTGLKNSLVSISGTSASAAVVAGRGTDCRQDDIDLSGAGAGRHDSVQSLHTAARAAWRDGGVRGAAPPCVVDDNAAVQVHHRGGRQAASAFRSAVSAHEPAAGVSDDPGNDTGEGSLPLL